MYHGEVQIKASIHALQCTWAYSSAVEHHVDIVVVAGSIPAVPTILLFLRNGILSSQLKICSESVRSLAELLRETDLSEIEYQVDSLRIRVVRSTPQVIAPVTSANIQSESQKLGKEEQNEADFSKHPGAVLAQMVGTVYMSPGPNAPAYVQVGDTVEEGQTLFIIEAMKVMNMIKAPKRGVVKHILVKDAHPVEYGEPVMIIE